MLLSGDEVHLDVQGRLLNRETHLHIRDTSNPGKALPQFLSVVLEDGPVLSVEAHDNWGAFSGDNLAAGLIQIRLYLALKSRIALERLIDGRDGRIVIRRRRKIGQNFGRIDVDRAISKHSAAHKRSHLVDARDGAQFTGHAIHEANHFRVGRARRRLQADQQVALLERREHWRPNERDYAETDPAE